MSSTEVGAYASDQFPSWVTMWKNGATDWSSGSLDWPMHFMFDNWNFPYMCGICKRGEICSVPLQRCNKCKIAHYCCREHQMKAWPTHKISCKHFARLFKEFYTAEKINNPGKWKFFIVKSQALLRAYSPSEDPLKHRMNSDEWFSQRHCQACFFNPAGPVPDRKLVECPTCHCAAHCSTPECTATFQRLHTTQACEKYLIGLASLVISVQGGGQAVQTTQTREPSLHLPTNWADYFARKIEDMGCHPAFMRFPPMMAMITDSLSLPMTILCSLQVAHGAAQLSTMKRIEVHIVGAESAEKYMAIERLHEILHWLPACRELVVYFVAPVCNFHEPGAVNRTYTTASDPACAACHQSGAKMHIRYVHGLYHEVVAPRGTLSQNNASNKLLIDQVSLVIACNAGLHDDAPHPDRPTYASTWQPTLQFLLDSDLPCVFTSYNGDEIVQDQAVLVKLGARVVLNAQLNPFRGLRPFPEIGEDNAFYYTNHSLVQVQGKV